MKKLVLVVAALIAMSGVSHASISVTWMYLGATGNLNDEPTGPYSVGWLVQLYKDVGNDSVLSSVSGFTPVSGAVVGAANLADDVLVASQTTSLDTAFGAVYWAASPTWDALMDNHVYTVIFNANSFPSATEGIVIDSVTHHVPNATDAFDTYTLDNVAGSWVPVPEPASLALMGIGAMIIGIRKAIRK